MYKICTKNLLAGIVVLLVSCLTMLQPLLAGESGPTAALSVPKQLLRAMASDKMTDADRERFAQKLLGDYKNIIVPLIAESLTEENYCIQGIIKVIEILATVDTPQSAELMATMLANSTGSALLPDIEEISDWKGLSAQILKGAEDKEPSAAGRVYKLLPPTLSQALKTLASGANDKAAMRSLLTALNNLMLRRDLYDAESFASVSLPATIRALFDQNLPSITEPAVIQLNKVLLAAAFPQIPGYEPVEDPGDPYGLAVLTGFANMRTPEATEYLINTVAFGTDRMSAHIAALGHCQDPRSNTIMVRYLASANKRLSIAARNALVSKAKEFDISHALSQSISFDQTLGLFGHVTSNFLQACKATEDKALLGEAYSKFLSGVVESRRAAINELVKSPTLLSLEPVREGLKSAMEAELILSQSTEKMPESRNSIKTVITALTALMKSQAPEAVNVVAVGLESKNKSVNTRACEAMEALTGEHLGYSTKRWLLWLEKQPPEE